MELKVSSAWHVGGDTARLIHSMELKVEEALQYKYMKHLVLNPFNGIERLWPANHDMPCSTNTLESIQWNWKDPAQSSQHSVNQWIHSMELKGIQGEG